MTVYSSETHIEILPTYLFLMGDLEWLDPARFE
jgi:hypothetical protein